MAVPISAVPAVAVADKVALEQDSAVTVAPEVAEESFLQAIKAASGAATAKAIKRTFCVFTLVDFDVLAIRRKYYPRCVAFS